MSDSYVIRPESREDHAVVRSLHTAAFGGDGVADLVEDLRALRTPYPTVSIVAATGPAPVGHVMLSHAWLDAEDRLIDVLVLSPLAVDPARQKQGIGTALLAASLRAAADLGAPLVFLEGHPRYYGPRGFENAMALGFRRPSLRIPESAFQVARLPACTEGMTGTFVYKDVHWRHGVGLYRKR